MSETETQTRPAVPKGFRLNGEGHHVPITKIKKIDLDRDKLVMKHVRRAIKHNIGLAQFKREGFADVDDFMVKSRAEYQNGEKKGKRPPGGEKGNMRMYSYDQRFRLDVSVNKTTSFDERLQIAEGLIGDYIKAEMKGSSHDIQALIQHAFRVDKKGNVSVERLMGLRALDIKHPIWLEAMKAIADSGTTVSSKRYIRMFQRDENTGEYLPISLDVAKA